MRPIRDDDLYGADHVRTYRETGGERGYLWRRDTTTLLLTTVGHRSGEERTTPLIFREIDGTYVVVASKGGSPEHPSWYENLRARPEARIQVLDQEIDVRARDAGPDERPRLWAAMTEVWPDYDDYQAKTQREIPVVVLEPR